MGFKGYYVDVPDGGDAMKAYRKIKKWIKNDRFLEEQKDRQYYQKPSYWKRETEKRKKQKHVSRKCPKSMSLDSGLLE